MISRTRRYDSCDSDSAITYNTVMRYSTYFIVTFVIALLALAGAWWIGGSETELSGNTRHATSTEHVDETEADDVVRTEDVHTDGDGLIAGIVLSGPHCLVERNDRPCPDEPYVTTVDVFGPDGVERIGFVETNGAGEFEIELPDGVYNLAPRSGQPFPRCSSKRITIPDDDSRVLRFVCDTGIR